MVREFGQTGIVVAKADRNADPYQHIDHLREQCFYQEQKIKVLERDIQVLKAAERDRLTESGAWNAVKVRLDAQAVDWLKWGIRAMASALFVAVLSGCGLLIRLAWKGLQ
jgi:hypothetical protein